MYNPLEVSSNKRRGMEQNICSILWQIAWIEVLTELVFPTEWYRWTTIGMKLSHTSRVCIPSATNVDFLSNERSSISESIIYDYGLGVCVGLDDSNHQII